MPQSPMSTRRGRRFTGLTRTGHTLDVVVIAYHRRPTTDFTPKSATIATPRIAGQAEPYRAGKTPPLVQFSRRAGVLGTRREMPARGCGVVITQHGWLPYS